MTSRKIDLGNIAELPRRYMVAKILEKRDDVRDDSRKAMNRSLTKWMFSAPYKTGTMRSTMIIGSDKYSTALVPRNSYMKVINSVNKRGKRAGFLDDFKAQQGKSFLSKW